MSPVHSKFITIAGLLLCTGITLLLYQHYILNENTEKAELRKYAGEIGQQVATNLLHEIKKTQAIVDSVGSVLKCNSLHNHKQPDSALINKLIDEILRKRPHLNGAFIVLTNNGSIGSGSQYISKSGNKNQQHSSQTLAAQIHQLPWYPIPAYETSAWMAPYFNNLTGKRTATFFLSIKFSNGISCIVGADYLTSNIYRLLNNWKSGRIGYPYLMNHQGKFIAHPNDDIRTLKEIGKSYHESTLIRLADSIAQRSQIDPLQFYHRNTVSKAMSWETIIHVKNPDWYLGFSVTDQQVYSNPQFFNQQRRSKINFSFIFFGGLLLVELCVLSLLFRTTDLIILSGWAIFIFLFLEIMLLFHLSLKYPVVEFSDMDISKQSDQKIRVMKEEQKGNQNILKLSQWFDRWNFAMLLDEDGANDYIRLYSKSLQGKSSASIHIIPTGLHILTIKFTDSYTAKLSGYAWQIYPYPTTIKPGLFCPDAESSFFEKTDSTVILTQNRDKAVFYRWYFNIEIREAFNYSNFPFDYNDLWIRLWSLDFNNNVILIPDFNSYSLLHPSFKPGLDHDLIISGWDIGGSYFSFKEKNYNTCFDPNYDCPKDTFPELHYNIILVRNSLNVIITRMIPIIVLLLMAYSILRIEKHQDALDVAIACSGLLFVAVFEHINLRHNLDAPGIIYMEYFYFTTYLLLMLVSVNAMLDSYLSDKLPSYISFSRLTGILYWPLALFIIFVATLCLFY